MEVRQALADLAEVRGRLATVQRFEGYSGTAAIASGVIAVVAGLVQALLAPQPQTPAARATYLAIWLVCLGIALAVNYGAIVAWRVRNTGAQAGVQFRTVGMSIMPAIAAGGVITYGLYARGLDDLFPGMWCATYALGLFASRALVPRDVVFVAVAFGAIATALLVVPNIHPLSWWIMPVAFGGGQIAIGTMVRIDPLGDHARS